MKLFFVLAILPLFVSGVPSNDHEAIIQRNSSKEPHTDPGIDLVKRQCDYDTPCKGWGWDADLHCGDGNYGCVRGHVFQIGSDPTNVCDYGVRTTCQNCDKLKC